MSARTSNPQRYGRDADGVMEQDENGDWVRYEDYERLRNMADWLRALLREYGRHLISPACSAPHGGKCSCGWQQVEKDLTELRT